MDPAGPSRGRETRPEQRQLAPVEPLLKESAPPSSGSEFHRPSTAPPPCGALEQLVVVLLQQSQAAQAGTHRPPRGSPCGSGVGASVAGHDGGWGSRPPPLPPPRSGPRPALRRRPRGLMASSRDARAPPSPRSARREAVARQRRNAQAQSRGAPSSASASASRSSGRRGGGEGGGAKSAQPLARVGPCSGGRGVADSSPRWVVTWHLRDAGQEEAVRGARVTWHP